MVASRSTGTNKDNKDNNRDGEEENLENTCCCFLVFNDYCEGVWKNVFVGVCGNVVLYCNFNFYNWWFKIEEAVSLIFQIQSFISCISVTFSSNVRIIVGSIRTTRSVSPDLHGFHLVLWKLSYNLNLPIKISGFIFLPCPLTEVSSRNVSCWISFGTQWIWIDRVVEFSTITICNFSTKIWSLLSLCQLIAVTVSVPPSCLWDFNLLIVLIQWSIWADLSVLIPFTDTRWETFTSKAVSCQFWTAANCFQLTLSLLIFVLIRLMEEAEEWQSFFVPWIEAEACLDTVIEDIVIKNL